MSLFAISFYFHGANILTLVNVTHRTSTSLLLATSCSFSESFTELLLFNYIFIQLKFTCDVMQIIITTTKYIYGYHLYNLSKKPSLLFFKSLQRV